MHHQLAGHLQLAQPLYQKILRADPRHAAANHCLGMLYVQTRRSADALPHLLAALETEPQNADYWLGYLEALLSNGQLDDATAALALGRRHGLDSAAVDEFARRLRARVWPGNPEARPPPAGRPAARAARRREDRVAVDSEKALLGLLTAGNWVDAGPAARALTERFPDRGLGWKIFGALQWADGRTDLALMAMQKSVELLPQDAEALANLGALLTKLERVDAAEAYLNKALKIDPDLAIAYVPLGDVYQIQGRYEEAEAVFRRAISLPYQRADWHEDMRQTSLLFVLSHNPNIAADALFAEHRRVGMGFEQAAHSSRREPLNSRDPERSLRIGVVSGDLYNHPVASFIEPILEHMHGLAGLGLSAYYNHVIEDETTGRLRRHFERWRPIAALPDPQLQQQIIDDGIDVLIDLSGHTSRNRLRAFARKPAPVQASWVGYPGTTGLRAMDYYFADPCWLPPGQFDRHFVEKLVYLPTAAIFQPERSAPDVVELPALTTGRVTFGSFNRLGKINAQTVGLWSMLLRALPTSRLLLAGIPLDARHDQLLQRFAAEGVAAERLICHARGPMDAYLALHHKVDLCLDTFPYSGGTTTHHALWMGVPTLTMPSTTPAGRQGAGILKRAGLEEFIAIDAVDFVAKGLYWATRLALLAELRMGLRERCRQRPDQRPDVLVAGLEHALRRMWTRWCAGLPAESFIVGSADS